MEPLLQAPPGSPPQCASPLWSSSMLLPGNQSLLLPETSPTEPADQQPAGLEAVMVPVVFGLIFVVGVFGNCLVMLVIGKVRCGNGSRDGGGRNGSSPTNVFILNLCAADLLFLIFCVPLHATIYSLPEWLFGEFLCKFAHFFSTVFMLVSIFTLASMSVDRYIAVVRSGTSSSLRSRRNALAALCVIWTLSLVCSVPVAQHQVLVTHPRAPNSTFCWEEWSGASKHSYKVSVLLLGFLLPLLLISCCYIRVLFHLHKKMKNMSKKSERSKTKTAQTVLLLVAAFTICWMPHHIIAMWVEFGKFPLNDASFVFRIVSHCLSYGNSCVNPILYAFLSENFRQACHQVFTCRFLFPPSPSNKGTRCRMENCSTTHSF